MRLGYQDSDTHDTGIDTSFGTSLLRVGEGEPVEGTDRERLRGVGALANPPLRR